MVQNQFPVGNYLICCVLVLMSVTALSQHKQLERVYENIQEGDFSRVEKNLTKLQQEYDETVYESAALYYLFSTKNHPQYNPDSAFYHLKKVESNIAGITSREDIELILIKMQLNGSNIRSLELKLAEASWESVVMKNSWQAADTFFSRYNNFWHHTDSRLRWRDRMEFNYYVENGNAEALKKFEKSSKNTYFKTQALLAADSIQYNQVQAIDSEESWLIYIQEHPKSKYTKSAQEKYELRVFNQTKSYGEPDSLNRYLRLFPKGKFLSEAHATQEKFLFIKLRDKADIPGLVEFRKKHPHSEYMRQVEELIESICWENATTEGTLYSYITYLELSTLLEHSDESEQQILNMWPLSWQCTDRIRLDSILLKVKTPMLKTKLQFAIGSLLLDEIKEENNLANLENFIRKNSDSVLIEMAKTIRPSVLFHEYGKTKKFEIGLLFITDYPIAEETPMLREELANQYISKVPKGEKPDLVFFMKYFENTSAYYRILPTIEKEYFTECSRRNSVKAYREYLDKFPNGAYLERAQTCILLAWNDSYLDNRKKLFNSTNFDFTADFYLTSPIVSRFFKSNRNELQDLLAEYFVMQQDVEENRYYYYSGHPEARYNYYFDHIGLLKKMGLPYEVHNDALYIDGITFYDKQSSVFCWKCSPFINSKGNGPLVILDDQNNELTGSSYRSIVGTAVPHIFLIQNSNEKYSLFNTKERKFITGWHNEVKPVLLDANTFPQNSLEYSLFRIFPIPIGFLTIDDKKQCSGCEQRLINFTGDLLIDPAIASEPCLFNFGLGGNSVTTIDNARTFQPLRNYGAPEDMSFTSLFVFSKRKLNERGYYDEYFGIMNGTLDTVLIEPNYTSIYDINDFGLIRVQHEKPSKSCKNYKSSAFDLINIDTKKNVTNNYGGARLEQNYIPFSSSGEFIDEDLAYSRSYINDISMLNNYSIEEREEYEGYDEDIENRIIPDSMLGEMNEYIYSFPRPVFYFQELNYSDCNNKYHQSYELLNSKGISIYNSTSRISQHSCLGNKVMFQIEGRGCILLSENGELIFDGALEKYYMQFINQEYLYFWKKEDSAKSVGIYSILKGKVYDAVYENITIERDGVYGYKLGSKSKLDLPLKSNRDY
jgi:hypothetical protein